MPEEAEMAGEMTIRAAREEDAAALLKIYEPYVLNTVVTFEVEVPTTEEFAGRIRKTLAKYPYLVAELDGEIVGYAYGSQFRTRAAYDWSAETSVYVKTGIHRAGVGSALYRALDGALRGMGIVTLVAGITYPNPESVCFHEKQGYRRVGVMEKIGYKAGQWRDVLWMTKALEESAEAPLRSQQD
jgi:phosphinothricin acetyltransferase